MLHIGKKIKEVLDLSNLNVAEFARKISVTRVNVYNIFERDTIDTGLLKKISKVLNHDFFSYYTSELPMVKDEGGSRYGKKTDAVEQLREELKATRKQMAELEKKCELLMEVNTLTKEKLKNVTAKRKKA
jgi:transcriptional regulator with XRE-family HTH domain